MTGKDLIMYILENNLENEPVAKNGKLIGFMTVSEVAVKMNVSFPTVLVWANQGMLDGIQIGGKTFFPVSSVQSLLNKK